LTEIEPVQLAF